jgi:hypothetical protein
VYPFSMGPGEVFCTSLRIPKEGFLARSRRYYVRQERLSQSSFYYIVLINS